MRRILSFIMLFLVLKVIKAQFLTYDFGIEQRFNYGVTNGFLCENGAIYTFDIAYNGKFERNPQILISPDYQAVGFQTPAGYTLHKSKESTTGFQVNVTCPWLNRMYSLRFNWTAIDDKRIEIFDVFNLDMANIPNQNYTFFHQNPNALQGFVILVSFAYKGPINITLDINEITKTQVSIRFTTSNNNLLSLGYQIILGTSKAFNQSATIYSQISSTVFYQSGTLTIPKGQKLITPFSGLYYPDVSPLHYRLVRGYSENTTTIVYSLQNWDGTYQDLWHKQVWLSLPITQSFTPMIVQKMRIVKKDNPYIAKQDIMRLTIVELNKSFKFTTDSTSIELDSAIQTLNIIVYFKCEYWQEIVGEILQCFDCLVQLTKVNQFCYSSINEVIYYIRFIQKDQVYQKINIDVNNQGFLITQSIINQTEMTYKLLSFQIQNK